MSISSRIRERAAEVVRVTSDMPTEQRIRIMTAILAIPDDEQEVAIRAACMAEAAEALIASSKGVARYPEQIAFLDGIERGADIVRALAPAPSGWVCVRVAVLDHLLLNCGHDVTAHERCDLCEEALASSSELCMGLPEDRS